MSSDGYLQDGIALALAQHRVVVCFVTGTNAQSTIWEHQYLKDEEISDQLNDSAIVLRVEQGSKEAGYLTAFYPIPTSPAVVVINNGQQIADIHGDHSLESFKERLLWALNTNAFKDSVVLRSSATDSVAFDLGTEAGSAFDRREIDQPVDPEVQRVLEERKRRLEIDQRHKAVAEKAQHLAKQEARRVEAEAAAPDSARAKQASHAQQQKKRRQELMQERERILSVIENDKVERKHKEALRKALVEAKTRDNDRADGLIAQQLTSEMSHSRPQTSPDCVLQVRLFEGTTIRSRFPPEQNIRDNVRKWIDEQRTDSDTPYTFRQVLAPKPNQAISISEEEQSLQSLGLTPSATLIMVPVQGYTAAYAANRGYLSEILAAGFNVISDGVSWIAGAMLTFLGIGAVETNLPKSHGTTQAPTEDTQVGSTSTIRTLRDQQKSKDSQHFYNGNQVGRIAFISVIRDTDEYKLSFEPRRDEESTDDKL
ncbi:hypothetical protein MMC17_006371 [Xylographa soralifera]|nr:hypothetical protein [Xylographa soralifera]